MGYGDDPMKIKAFKETIKNAIDVIMVRTQNGHVTDGSLIAVADTVRDQLSNTQRGSRS